MVHLLLAVEKLIVDLQALEQRFGKDVLSLKLPDMQILSPVDVSPHEFISWNDQRSEQLVSCPCLLLAGHNRSSQCMPMSAGCSVPSVTRRRSQRRRQRVVRGPQSKKIRVAGNGGPITGCLIHRVTKYKGHKDVCVRLSFLVLPFCK